MAATGVLDDLTDDDDDDATSTPFVIVATEADSDPTEEESAPGEGVMQAGESGTIDGVQVIYLSARRDDSGLVSPDDGNEYIILRFEIENTNSEEVVISTLLQFELRDREGGTFNIALFADIEEGLDTELPANEQIEGEVAFEIPEGGGPYVVAYDDFLSDAELRWQVN